jgi:D-methionine transport system substrate-binding protein
MIGSFAEKAKQNAELQEEKMKRKSTIISALLIAVLVMGMFAACGNSNSGSGSNSSAPSSESSSDTPDASEPVKIKVGASPTPHAEILGEVISDLEAQGITLEIQEFTDYVLPNTALDTGDLDANYFQHEAYLNQFNEENGTKLVNLAKIHYEPFGLYPGKSAKLEDIKEGTQIAVPNDASNEARALLLLEANGLIKLKEGTGLEATKNDIKENTKKIDIVEIEASQLPKSLQDVDFAVINGNYALEAGLSVADDALFVEAQDSLAAQASGNLIAIHEGDESRPELKALAEALQTDKIKKFIEDNDPGAVVPLF